MAYRTHIMVCAGTGCVSNGAFQVKAKLEDEIKSKGLEDEVLVVTTGCNGFCAQGPIVVFQPDGIFYQLLEEKDVPRLVEEHCLKGRPVKELMYVPEKEETPVPIMNDIEFFKHQRLIALRNRGLVDPEKIEDYIGRDGYTALRKALSEMTAEQIIDEIKKSGLRGRGGAGFPTGVKWELAAKQDSDIKYIVCNADEGDPGAFMDRSIIESDPHSVIEGMTIGAKAIGTNQGFVYVRNEYPLALERLLKAIEDAKEYGLLGEDIFGLGFNFDITVHRGAGAFVCGEESALLQSLEGRPGEPRPRPPYPAEKGLWGKPTVINNVETWANVPMIIGRGSDWFASIGTEGSKGTKVFSLVGKINNTGLVEVPMGISLKKIIDDIGGGCPGDKKFKAVQTGGPSGGCIPASLIDLPVDYESLTEAGSMMGSGGMVVMDEDTCMVDVAKYFLTFTQDESCGKCTPCREGTKEMLSILTRITEGNGTEHDLETLDQLAHTIADASLCGLGKTAPNPVLTTMKYFRDEYEAHIRDKKCPAHVCKALITYTINEDNCLNVGKGCDRCRKECPSDAIIGEPKQAHRIIQDKCIKCGACYDVCKFNSIVVE
jgi:NADP-reducing hydrogenase subunit HndC